MEEEAGVREESAKPFVTAVALACLVSLAKGKSKTNAPLRSPHTSVTITFIHVIPRASTR